uniref:U-box domain containing 5 n=1 Tax=Mastacembelus armatus TaxID=205130 RepID=A0A3Q3MSP6_9TELE
MVVNLCLPHFYTTVHCNKLCADGYDVTNLVSADPALRRRGFKLEYFLRPPVQVTLKFDFQVELSRVDIELWPWGMDQGQACKRLEISTSSDVLPSQGHVFKCQSDTESCYPGLEFKLVGRCDVRDETRVCFTHSNFSPRSPFLSPAPPPPTNCRQETLWSRGLLSLGAVTHLRVAVPFGGAASALGLKALAVWGQPARCCPAEEVERIKRTHEASESRPPQPVFFAPHVRQIKQEVKLSIPEEFLDPITQEVMCLPMLLPSGVSVDNTTLEEYNKREATWGRPPNDPFTGVLFTSTSQPLPNPQLKTRIDHFLLQKGEVRRDGMLGRRGKGGDPQASRLIASSVDRQSQNSPCLSKSSINNTSVQYNAGPININRTTLEGTGSGHSSDKGNDQFNSQSKKTCSACSLSVSVYASSVSSIYRLTCGHLLCHTCLRRESQLNSATSSTSNHVSCATCHSPTPRAKIIRVHY